MTLQTIDVGPIIEAFRYDDSTHFPFKISEGITDDILMRKSTGDLELIPTGGSAGSGLVAGPSAGSTDNAVARWDGTTGLNLNDSVMTLDDVGAATITSIAGNSASMALVSPTTFTSGFTLKSGADSVWSILTNDGLYSGALAFLYGLSPLVYIDQGGQMGIGEVSPASLLDVAGKITTNGMLSQSGNSKIVQSNSQGAAQFQGAGGASNGGTIDFANNTAAIGISDDGVLRGYDYTGTYIFKQKASNPAGAIEFIFIEEAGDWRFALPASGVGFATFNPRSMIIAGPSTNVEANCTAAHWGFDLPMNTSAGGADLGVQNDIQVLGESWLMGQVGIGTATPTAGIELDVVGDVAISETLDVSGLTTVGGGLEGSSGGSVNIVSNLIGSPGNLAIIPVGGTVAITGALTVTGNVTGSNLNVANWDDAYTRRVDTWTAPLTFAGNVADVTTGTLAGTANQVVLSATGADRLIDSGTITLSLPQDIHTGASPTFAGGTFNGNVDVSEYIRHVGDTNTDFRFLTDRVQMHVGGSLWIDAQTNTVGINSENNDINFFVDTVTTNNALLIDAGANTATFNVPLTVSTGAAAITAITSADDLIVRGDSSVGISILGSTNTGFGYLVFGDSDANARGYLEYNHTGDVFKIFSGGAEMVSMITSEVVFNNNLTARDFRVETSEYSHALFLDGSTGCVGINHASPHAIESKSYDGTTDSTFVLSVGAALAAGHTAILNISADPPILLLNDTSQGANDAIACFILDGGSFTLQARNDNMTVKHDNIFTVDTSSGTVSMGGPQAGVAQVEFTQPSTTGGIPVLQIEQLDIDQPLIRFDGETLAGNLTYSLVDSGDEDASLRRGWIKITIEDAGSEITDGEYYLDFYELFPPV